MQFIFEVLKVISVSNKKLCRFKRFQILKNISPLMWVQVVTRNWLLSSDWQPVEKKIKRIYVFRENLANGWMCLSFFMVPWIRLKVMYKSSAESQMENYAIFRRSFLSQAIKFWWFHDVILQRTVKKRTCKAFALPNRCFVLPRPRCRHPCGLII